VSVSVVIPVYNAERWITETLESVISQREASHLEVVVVDDGSSDASVQIARRLLERSGLPHQILRRKNGGASAARNAGWRAASGEWIQFLDADDLLGPGKIAGQLARAHDGVDLVYSDMQVLEQKRSGWVRTHRHTPALKPDLALSLIEKEGFLQVGSYLVRRSAVERVGGFDERLSMIEDVNLLLRLALGGAVFRYAPLEEPGVLRRYLRTSLSNTNRHTFFACCLTNVELAEQWWRDRGELTQERAEGLAGVYAIIASGAMEVDPLLVRKAMDLGLGLHRHVHLTRLQGLARVTGLELLVRSVGTWRRSRRALSYLKHSLGF
jgi:glycosyltransferase involved in cell wall biosynthesis